MIHLGSGCDAIDGEVEKFSRTNGTNEAIDVETDVFVHFLFVVGLGAVFGVGAGVDDPVHVDIEVVGFEIRGVGEGGVEGHGD